MDFHRIVTDLIRSESATTTRIVKVPVPVVFDFLHHIVCWLTMPRHKCENLKKNLIDSMIN